MNNLQKALKLKASYTEKRGARDAFANGGAVHGPGTGTSDDVEASLSDGEYVLPADTVQAVGVQNLDQLKAATHTPVGTRDPMAFADGGLYEDPLKARAERLRNMTGMRAAVPPSVPWEAPAGPAVPNAQAQSLRAGPSAGAGLRETITARGVPPQAPVPPPAAPSGVRGALSTAGNVLKHIPGAAGVGLGGALAVGDSYQQSKALEGPNSGMDRAALAGENVGRFAAATAGASAGAAGGSAIFPGAGTVVGGLAGGLAGYFAPDAVKKATDFVGLTDKSTPLPSEKANGVRAAQRAAQQPAVQQAAQPAPQGAEQIPYTGGQLTEAQMRGIRKGVESGSADAKMLLDAYNQSKWGGATLPDQGVRGGGVTGNYTSPSAAPTGPRDAGVPPATQRLLDNPDNWAQVIRGTNVTEEWVGGDQYAPGTTKDQVRGRDAAFANFAAPGREAEARIQDVGLRREQQVDERGLRREELALTRATNDKNKDEDRAVKVEAQNMARDKESWAEFRRDVDRANTVQGPKGPIVDAAAADRQETGMRRGLATLGANSPADLSLENRERMKAAIELADKVNKIASNLNPLKPDPIASDDPTDLFGLERLPNGDAMMRNGKVIPKRVIDKVNSDFFMGEPTNKFNSLFKKDEVKNGVR